MRVSVKIVGLELAQARLAEVGRRVEPIMRGALNTTATASRREQYAKPLGGVYSRRSFVNARMKIKRANSRRLNSRVIPSSSGVPAVNYKQWGFDPLPGPQGRTRAKIWVRGPYGKKLAAGFVNPSSAGRLPWVTRSTKQGKGKNYSYQWANRRLAMGPSVAYWFKQMTNSKSIQWVNAFLQQEFELRIRRELAKAR
jgi:hypothetical protein